MSESFRNRAREERALAARTTNLAEARVALALAERLEALALVYEQLEPRTPRTRH